MATFPEKFQNSPDFFPLPLRGKQILVTRPPELADVLCRLLESHGAQVWRVPLFKISPLGKEEILAQWLSFRVKPSIIICVSVNAVRFAVPVLQYYEEVSRDCQWFAVGKKTALALDACGLVPFCAPPPFNSEALLCHPLLQEVQGKQVMIFRGDGGRELLAQSLRDRGAQVVYLMAYRRVPMALPPWINEVQPEVVVVTSGEILRQFFSRFAAFAWLPLTPLVLISPRLVEEARQLGSQAPLFVAKEASDEGLVMAVLELVYEQFIRSSPL